jgi:hypothetical protein
MEWQENPKAVEAVEYLLSIGFNAEDFLAADANASDYADETEE